MKKILYNSLIILILITGCNKELLDVRNRNVPTPKTLNTEAGMKKAALGVYGALVTPEGNFEGGLLSFNFIWFTLTNHELMGDALYCPFGNFSWRWINQVAEITLDNSTIVHPPQGLTQGEEIVNRNSREVGDDNATKHEWYSAYNMNNTANLILLQLSAGTVNFQGDAETKKLTLEAWARFWKGYAYSRIGSMYSAGLINDEWGKFNGNFVSHADIITEANRQFDLAKGIINQISNEEAYNEILEDAIPDLGRMSISNVPTPAEWIRNINTYEARNILVNTRQKSVSQTDWQSILTLANDGIADGDFIFVAKQDDETVTTALVPYRVLAGWAFPSERLIQDYKTGDDRLTRYFYTLSTRLVNMRGRGIQYGTRWGFNDETDLASTVAGQATVYLGATYEENELMKAEANIFLNNIDEGLASVDLVRNYQGAELADVANTGLNQTQALEELRRERRVGLLLKGLAFYDARRWGILDPVSEGGGRTGCVVLDANGNLNTNATFDYDYLNYFGVPANELDFNTPSTTSANVNPE